MPNHSEVAELIIKRTSPELKGQSHLQLGRRISFAYCPFVLGRPQDGHHPCDLNITSMRISKLRHAEIVFEDDRYWLIRHTRNLVALNKREIERGQRYMLENEDIIDFAGVIRFQVCLLPGDTWPVAPKGIWINNMPHPLVTVNGVRLKPSLSSAEFSFLDILYKNAGNTVTRDQIFDYVWPNKYGTEGQLDHVAHRLRVRLKELDPHEFIVTQRGVGYKLEQLQSTLDDLLEESPPAPEAPRKVSFAQTA